MKLKRWLIIIPIAFALCGATEPRAPNYTGSVTYAGMTHQQFLELLRSKMPLPVTRFGRQRQGDHYRYGIGLDATGIAGAKSPELTITFELKDNATRDELAKAIDAAAAYAVEQIKAATPTPSLPGTVVIPAD